MSIPLVGSGGIFTRLGHILGLIGVLNSNRGTTVPAHIATIFNDFTSADEAVIEGIFAQLASYQSTASGTISQLAAYAQAILQEMVAADGPQSSTSVVYCLNYLINQMVGASQTVNRSVVGQSWTAAGTNVGNGVLAVSLLTNRGVPTENIFAEKIVFTTTSDAQSGGATAGEEQVSYAGTLPVSDVFNWAWPAGSGCGGSLTAVDPTGQQQAGGTANWLNNSNFETFTVANVPDGWTVNVGAAGTQVLQSTSIKYDGASCISFVGNGSTLTNISQAFNSGTGTVENLAAFPTTGFVFNLWAKTSNTPAAGVLEIALVDGVLPTANVTQDDSGANNVVTVTLSTLGTTFKAISGFFRTPDLAPTTGYALRLRLSTALSAGTTLYMDRLSFAQPTILYSQGPRVAFFSGNVNTILNDSWTLTTTNTPGKFQQGFNQFFSTAANGLILPSSLTPTISDALVV